MKYQKNTIQLDIASYRHYWRGQAKVGKTTQFRDLVIEEYGDAKFGILLSIGQEIGYKSLDNLYAHDCPDWGEFVDTVDDLVENKKDNEFKLVAIDTVDELVEIAERKVLDLHRTSHNGEQAQSINAALGGYGAGKKKARSLIEEQIACLERAGYGMVYIGHTKVKDITEKATDQAYQQLTGSLEFAYDAIFSDRADIMAMFVTESTTKDDRLKASQRLIYLRPTNFIDAGSRMANLPDKIELNAKAYVGAIKSALEKTSGVSGKQAEQQRKQEEIKREEDGKKFVEKSKETKYGTFETVDEYRDEISKVISALSKEDATIKKAEVKRQNLPTNIKEIEDIETLKKIYAILNS